MTNMQYTEIPVLELIREVEQFIPDIGCFKPSLNSTYFHCQHQICPPNWSLSLEPYTIHSANMHFLIKCCYTAQHANCKAHAYYTCTKIKLLYRLHVCSRYMPGERKVHLRELLKGKEVSTCTCISISVHVLQLFHEQSICKISLMA